MTCYEQIMENCEDYLRNGNPYIIDAYRKEMRSSECGYIYNFEKDDFSVTMDLRVDESIDYIILEAQAEIETKEDEDGIIHQMLCDYCQQYSGSDEPGIMYVSDTHRYIVFRITTPIANASISFDTLNWMNSCAWKKLHAHVENLEFLAAGDFPPMIPDKLNKQSEEDKQVLTDNFHKTIEDLTKRERSNNNIIGKNIRDDNRRMYMDQIMTNKMIMYRELWFDESGCIIIAIRPELRIPRKYSRGVFAQYSNQLNSRYKVGGFHIINDDGHLWDTSAVSLWDGPVNPDTIHFLSSVLVSNIISNNMEIVSYAHGKIPDSPPELDIIDIFEMMKENQGELNDQDDSSKQPEDGETEENLEMLFN